MTGNKIMHAYALALYLSLYFPLGRFLLPGKGKPTPVVIPTKPGFETWAIPSTKNAHIGVKGFLRTHPGRRDYTGLGAFEAESAFF